MARLEDLSKEILAQIIDLIQATSRPDTFRALMLVNSRLRALVRYAQVCHLTLEEHHRTGTTLGPLSERLQHLAKCDLFRAVRRITVQGFLDMRAAILTVSAMLSLMPGLRDLIIRHPAIPDATIESIKRAPQVRLWAEIDDTFRMHGEKSNLYVLQNCHNLYSFEVEAFYSSVKQCLDITKPLKSLLLTCRNLRRLKLNIGEQLPPAGELIQAMREYCGLGFVNEERPPPLEDLCIVQYPFGRENVEDWEWPYTVGYPGQGTEQQYWVNYFDWSNLRRLSLLPEIYGVHANTLTRTFGIFLALKLPRLEDVEMLESTGMDVAEFFASLPSSCKLETISLTSIQDLFHLDQPNGETSEPTSDLQTEPESSALVQHSQRIRSLSAHDPEDLTPEDLGWPTGAITTHQLAILRLTCPGLRSLVVDMDRVGCEWPYENFNIISTFPNLETLTIHFQLTETPMPHLTYPAALHLFRYLRDPSTHPRTGINTDKPTAPYTNTKRAALSSLKELILECGDVRGNEYVDQDYWDPRIHPRNWFRENGARFKFLVSERDDADLVEGVKVITPLPDDKLERINELLKEHGEERDTNEEALMELFQGTRLTPQQEAALWGPVPYDDWAKYRGGWAGPDTDSDL
ncbi:hypothetical protein F4778DRAFT_695225 [Xylariomycetidae sp. FL2044]|nr:hypothetical protein F4778DRAFT_695225 [Xylariomycetidae sp. FL2044]